MATKKFFVGEDRGGQGSMSLEMDDRYATDAFMHIHAGGFSYCRRFDASEAKRIADAFLKAAFLIEQNTPQVEEAA